MSGETHPTKTILGIDMGTASLGWALLSTNQEGEPNGIVATGVRIFEQGTENTKAGNATEGYDRSRAIARREARGRRRLIDRQARRMQALFLALSMVGLLPEFIRGPNSSKHLAIERHDILQTLRNQVLTVWKEKLAGKPETLAKLHHLLPYTSSGCGRNAMESALTRNCQLAVRRCLATRRNLRLSTSSPAAAGPTTVSPT